MPRPCPAFERSAALPSPADWGITVWTRFSTSWAATLTSFSRTNWTKTCETPSIEVERSSSIPLIVLTASSTLSVISVSTSCGEAPGFTTVTVIVGKSIFGNRSTPERQKRERSHHHERHARASSRRRGVLHRPQLTTAYFPLLALTPDPIDAVVK